MGNLWNKAEKPTSTTQQKIYIVMHCVLTPGQQVADKQMGMISKFASDTLKTDSLNVKFEEPLYSNDVWKRSVVSAEIWGFLGLEITDYDHPQNAVIKWLLDLKKPEGLDAWITLPRERKATHDVQRQRILSPSSLSCGTFKEYNEFVCTGRMFKIGRHNKLQLHITGSFDKIGFCLYLTDKQSTHCLEWQAESLTRLLKVTKTSDAVELYIFVSEPPRIHQMIEQMEEPDIRSGKWSRRSFCHDFDRTTIGQSDVFKVSFESRQLPHIINFILQINKSGKEVHFLSHVVELPPRFPSFDMSVFHTRDFEVVWALERFLSCGLKAKTKLSCSLLKMMIAKQDEVILSLLSHFIRKLEYEDHFLLCIDQQDKVQNYNEQSPISRNKTKGGPFQIRQMIFTPTRQIFLDKQYVESNRILRQYSADHAVKVLFRDENCRSKLSNTKFHKIKDKVDAEILDSCIVQPLSKHPMVGNRKYHILGGSQSLLGEHGCYLYATDDQGKTAESIRKSVGNLYDIRCVPNYMARLGLAFSSTDESGIDIKPEMITEVHDVEGGADPSNYNKPYCFSDGIGCISEDLLKKAVSNIPNRNHRNPIPSAIQIRLGGCKGMLALDPQLSGERIIIRPSMKKFESGHTQLEIQAFSKPCRLNLNVQIITLLEQHGVNPEVFFLLLEEDLTQYWKGFFDENSMMKMLKWKGPSLNYTALKSKGVKLTDHQFFRKCLLNIFKAHLEDLEEKPQIPIPEDKGRNMFGVLDETGTLEYGQVYIQCSEYINSPGKRKLVVTETVPGEVIVSKMPALHPGDVRKLKAVDVSHTLGHMLDVIVFPQKGKRPHPNEMAGSDLDGDMYFVTWHSGFIFAEKNADPMHFPAAVKVQKSTPIVEADMIQHIKTFVLSDMKGIIASAHLKQADYQEKGIYSQECLRLAEVNSLVLDAPKTGNLPDVPYEYFLDKTPDFMGGHGHRKTYESQRLLGRLHRYIKRMKILMPDEISQPYQRSHHKSNNNYSTREELRILSERYGTEMTKLMEKYQSNELQILCKRLPAHLRHDKSTSFEVKLKGLKEDVQQFTQRIEQLIIRMVTKENCQIIFEESLLLRDYTTSDCCQGLPWLILNSVRRGQISVRQSVPPVVKAGQSVIQHMQHSQGSRLVKFLEEIGLEKGKLSAFCKSDAVVFVSEYFLDYMNTQKMSPSSVIEKVLGTARRLEYFDMSPIPVRGIKAMFSSFFRDPVKEKAIENVKETLKIKPQSSGRDPEQVGRLIYEVLLSECRYLGTGTHPSQSEDWQHLFKGLVHLVRTGSCPPCSPKHIEERHPAAEDRYKETDTIVVDKAVLDHIYTECRNDEEFEKRTGLDKLDVNLEFEDIGEKHYKVSIQGDSVSVEKAKTIFQKMNS